MERTSSQGLVPGQIRPEETWNYDPGDEQRNIVKSGRREITPIGAKVSDRRAIGGCVSGVRRDGHWRGKVSLLPARRGFAGKRDCAKQSARRAPQVADVSGRYSTNSCKNEFR